MTLGRPSNDSLAQALPVKRRDADTTGALLS